MHHIPNKFRLCVQMCSKPTILAFLTIKRGRIFNVIFSVFSKNQCYFLFPINDTIAWYGSKQSIKAILIYVAHTFQYMRQHDLHPFGTEKNFINFDFFRMTQKFLTICAFWVHILQSLFLRNISFFRVHPKLFCEKEKACGKNTFNTK